MLGKDAYLGSKNNGLDEGIARITYVGITYHSI